MDYKRLVYILILCIVTMVLSNGICEKSCTCTLSSITCEGTIPKSVPPNVTTVIIIRFLSLHKSLTTIMDFSHESFSHVKALHINPNEDALSAGNQHIFNGFPDDAFVGLSNLEVLQYASLNLKRLSTYSLRGLECLRVLDLSNNVYLPGSEVAKALSSDIILPKLEVLRLSNIQKSFQLGDFDDKAAVMKLRPIKMLDLSRLTLEVGEEKVFSAFPNTETLNISGCVFGVTSATQAYFTISAPTITSLDISSTNLFDLIQTFMSIFRFLDHVVVLPFEFRYRKLYMNDLNNKDSAVHVNFSVKKGRNCFIITFNKTDHIADLDICFTKRRTAPLVKFAVRENNLRYFSSEVFCFFNRLEYVNLHGNDLVFMQRHSLIEFEKLFSCNNNLTELILSRNSLTDLPRNIFNENSKLRILDLSHNRISSVSFSLTNRKALSFLDLSFNQIKALDQESISKLSAFEAMLVSPNLTTSLSLAGNEFQCKCGSEKMVRWFLENRLTEKLDDVKCSFEGKEEAYSEQLLSDVEYSCKETQIIVAVTTVTVLLTLAMTIAAVLLYKKIAKMRKMKHKKELIDLYKTDNKPQKYTVFLSYSSLDIDFIMTKVYKQLNKKLQELLNTEEDCVATGDTDFLPGYQLANEIIRCIEESSVVVLFMTKNFCTSPWCKDEAMAAHYDRKPIILMFGEHVDSKFMPKPLQRHLQVYSRVFWKNEGGEWKLKPDWTKLCEAIISFVKR